MLRNKTVALETAGIVPFLRRFYSPERCLPEESNNHRESTQLGPYTADSWKAGVRPCFTLFMDTYSLVFHGRL